jgi:hypothetical protein
MTPPIVNILNTVTGAADATITGGKVAFPNVSGFPVIDYLKIKDSVFNQSTVYTPVTPVVFAAGCKRALQEQSASFDITFTAANNQTYAFTIEQVVNEKLQVIPFSYTSDSTGSAAEIASAFVSAINAATSLRVTASGTGSPITVVAQPIVNGGTANFTIIPQGNVAVDLTKNAALSAGGGSAISGITNATPRVVSATAHGLKNGQTIVLRGCAGAGTIPTSVNGIAFQVQVVNANSFSLVGSTNAGAITVAAVEVYFPGQEPLGQYADVLKSLVAAGSTNLPTVGQQYAQVNLVYNTDDTSLLNTQREDYNQAILWVNQGSSTTVSAAPDANYLLLETQVATILGGGGSAYLAVPTP